MANAVNDVLKAWAPDLFPDFADRFSQLCNEYPAGQTDLTAWTNHDLRHVLEILDLGPKVQEIFEEEEFLPEDGEDDDDNAFGSIEMSDLESMFEDKDLEQQLTALKLCLRYLRGEFTNVSLKA
mmetsp:Transcript_11705/g.43621  ORF Transcript_11705/g.43621 Transcript_11705/m.43621 type:complete len:124 (-) Transcript_11705:892-1263(-)